jgi:hypothetical protein
MIVRLDTHGAQTVLGGPGIYQDGWQRRPRDIVVRWRCDGRGGVVHSRLPLPSQITETWGHCEWRWSYRVLIRPAACYQVSIPAEWYCQEAAEQARSTHADRAKDRALPTLPDTDIPGPACMFASFTPLPVRSSMSSQYPQRGPRQTPAQSMWQSRASQRKLHHDCHLMRVTADLSYATTIVCGVLLLERPFF